MAIVKKFKPNQIYIPKRIINKLETIFEFPLTIVEAPTGYGKTTILKWFLKKSKYEFVWFNIDNHDKNQFFLDLCKKINTIDINCAKQISELGYPTNFDTAKKIAKIILDINFKNEILWVFDNYHFISDEFCNRIIFDLGAASNLKVVVLTQEIIYEKTFEMVVKKQLNYIGLTDLEFSKTEISDYSKLSGIKIDDEETELLYNFSNGWISAVYLLLFNYSRVNKFERNDDLYNLVINSIWLNMNKEVQEFLIYCSVFERFSLNQALFIFSDKLSSEQIKKVLNKNAFIRYDIKDRKYYFQAVLNNFLLEEFEKLEEIYKKEIYIKLAQWYNANNEFFQAIIFYHKIKDYERILSLDCKAEQILKYATKINKNLFMDIVYDTPIAIISKYTLNYLFFMYSLFIYNQREQLISKCNQLRKIIMEKEYSDSYQKNILLADLECINSLTYYNDITLMTRSYIKAKTLINEPSRLFDQSCSMLFNCPLVLGQYHKKVGQLDYELQELKNCMPTYYQLTKGSAKGIDALMQAQALFYRGDLDSADVLVQKCIYMAESRNQNHIIISALFLAARIAIFKNDYKTYQLKFSEMCQTANEFNDCENSITFDSCKAFLQILLEDENNIPEWLKDSQTIENTNCIFTLGFSNVIYGKYLIVKEEYTKLLGISGQFIGITNIFSTIIYQIYTYIFIAIANYKQDNSQKARKFIETALELAVPDDLVMPFVENYNEIEGLINEMELRYICKAFVIKLTVLAKSFNMGKKMISKILNDEVSFGLTKREIDVAKLAAQRMSNKEIADKLFIAESTVKSNMKIIFNKLGINSRASLKDFFQVD